MAFTLCFLILHLIVSSLKVHSAQIPNQARGHAEVGYYPFMDMNSCGYISPKDMPAKRIVEGELAIEGEFPWMASLHYQNSATNDSFRCGAGLINRNWALTAAHCFNGITNLSSMKVFLGSVDKYKYHNVFDVVEYVLHPDYDLALLRLKGEALPVYMADHFVINYICLPKLDQLNNEEEVAIVSGFGAIDQSGQIPSQRLRKTFLNIQPYYECVQLNYTMKHICSAEFRHMTCFGDSGSPLVQFDGNRAVLIGVVIGSSSRSCGLGYLYFARISFFTDWIASFVDRTISASQQVINDSDSEPKESNASNGVIFLWLIIFGYLVVIIKSHIN